MIIFHSFIYLSAFFQRICALRVCQELLNDIEIDRYLDQLWDCNPIMLVDHVSENHV